MAHIRGGEPQRTRDGRRAAGALIEAAVDGRASGPLGMLVDALFDTLASSDDTEED